MVMPSGALSASEKRFAEAMATTGDKAYAAAQTGSKHVAVTAHRYAQKPEIQAEIARIQTERLYSEALPAAVNCLVSIITSDKAPAGARVQASKVVLDRTLGADGAAPGKEPHEMTAEEIADAIAKLETVAAARAKPVGVLQQDTTEGDIFA